MKTMFRTAWIRFIVVIASVVSVVQLSSPTSAQQRDSAYAVPASRSVESRAIPTTSNPTGSGVTASRTYANTSFEQSDYACWSAFNGQHWAAIGQDLMRGWSTAHSGATETNCPGNVRSGQRVIEVQTNRNGANEPYDGLIFAELNAFEASFVYQKLCMKSGESFDFTFHHKTLSANRSDILVMRFGIPSGLPTGAEAADTYSRPVMYAKTTGNSSRYASAAAYTGFTFDGTTYTTPAGTSAPVGIVTSTFGWAEYSGTHTLPSDASWNGVRNLGFQAIAGDSPNGGNLLDGITVGLSPLVDLGSSRDTIANEQSTPTALRIRINGRVVAGTKIALKATAGDAVPDTDYSIGAVTAGAFGSVTTTHTAGTNVWVFDIPPGDYDGGVTPANNTGGLSIPIVYTYDTVTEGAEYVQFAISNPGVDGGTTDWAKGDPTCDTSEKNDGVVYTITNVTRQTITFGALSNKPIGTAPFSVAATTSSNGAVTYTSSTTGVCTVTSLGVVTLRTTGTCTIAANAAQQTVGGTLYAVATEVSRSFTVTEAVQTITFNPTDKVYTAAPYNLTATIAPATGFALTYTTSTPSVCTVSSSGNVDLQDVGVCTVTVTAAGGTVGGVTYGPATVTKSFNATPAVQTVTFPTLPEWRLYEGDEITPAAVANSGLAVTYTTTTPLVCSIVGGKIKVVGLGKCTVKASAAAGTSTSGTKFGASAEVQREFFITDAKPTATFTPTNTHTPTPTQTPTPIPLLLKKGAIGASFVLGLLQNDTLVTWGMGREGQSSIPPCCGSAIQDIAVGTNFALALKGGRVFGWGANTKGQMNFPTSTNANIVAVAAGGAHGLALTGARHTLGTGKVIAWGDNLFSQARVPVLRKVVTSVVGGNNHTVVLFADGTVSAWGSNSSKQASPPATLTGITQIAAGLDHNLALTNKGTVIGWGGNSFSQSTVPRNVIDIKQVSAGTQFSMAVKKNGEVIAWGRNDYNQTKIPREFTNIYSAFAGYANTILGLRNGRIIVLGDQNNGVAVSRTPTRTATPTP
jgi:hypothetical protein